MARTRASTLAGTLKTSKVMGMPVMDDSIFSSHTFGAVIRRLRETSGGGQGGRMRDAHVGAGQL